MQAEDLRHAFAVAAEVRPVRVVLLRRQAGRHLGISQFVRDECVRGRFGCHSGRRPVTAASDSRGGGYARVHICTYYRVGNKTVDKGLSPELPPTVDAV